MIERELFIKALRYLIDPDGSTGKEVAAQIQAGALNAEYFSDFSVKENEFVPSEYTILFEVCLDRFERYREVITDDILRGEIVRNKDLTPLEQKAFIDLVKEVCLEDYKPTEFPFIREEIEKAYVSNYTIYTCKKAILQSEENDDPLGSLTYIQRSITDLKSRLTKTKSKTDSTMWLWQLAEEKLKQYNETGSSVSATAEFGFPSWDKRFGGLYPEELTIFAGPKNSFKSGLQNRIVIHNLMIDKKVVWATKENSITQNWNRLLAFMTGIPLSVINAEVFDDRQRKTFVEAMETMRSLKDTKLLIVPPRECHTIQMLQNTILLNFGDDAPDLIAVDHIGRLKPSGRAYGQSWENVAAVVEETKDMLSFFGCPGISPAHLNRGGHKDESSDLNHMQFDSISQIADNIFMCKPDGDKPWKPPVDELSLGEPGVLNCTMTRARNHPKNIVLQLEVEPSVGMAEDYIGSTFHTPPEIAEAVAAEKKEHRKRRLGK